MWRKHYYWPWLEIGPLRLYGVDKRRGREAWWRVECCTGTGPRRRLPLENWHHSEWRKRRFPLANLDEVIAAVRHVVGEWLDEHGVYIVDTDPAAYRRGLQYASAIALVNPQVPWRSEKIFGARHFDYLCSEAAVDLMRTASTGEYVDGVKYSTDLALLIDIAVAEAAVLHGLLAWAQNAWNYGGVQRNED